LDKINKLRGVSFIYNNDSTGKRQIGFVAQEMEKVFPEFITTSEDGLKAVSYANITAVLLEGIKEQQQKIDNQQSQIDAQNDRLSLLEKKSGVYQSSGFGFSDSNMGLWIFLSASAFSVVYLIAKKRK
jgi:hypothetical protein